MGQNAIQRRTVRRRYLHRAILAAAAIAAGLIVAVPGSATASTGSGGALDPTRLDLKSARHASQTPSTSRRSPSAPLISTPCDTFFKSQTSPNKTLFNELDAVSATSPTDLWAAGWTWAGGSAVDHALVAHGNGSGWTAAGLTNAGNGSNDLNAVYAADPNDVWAVGVYQNSGIYYNLAWHWNGFSWTRIAVSQPSTIAQELAGISGLNSKDIWAVGFYGPGGGVAATLAMHWDGTTWTKVTTPDPGTNQINVLENVHAIAANDVWAVGYTQVTSGSSDQTLIEHWDGSAWTVITSANQNVDDNVLFDVSAAGTSDAWAVGTFDTGASTTLSTLVEHWNGTAWSVVTSPNNGTSDNKLLGVAAVSATNAWAVGFGIPTGGAPAQSLAEHWDGSTWSIVTSDNPDLGFIGLSGVTALPGSNVWAVGGQDSSGDTAENTLIEQFQLPGPTGVTATDATTGGSAGISWTAPVCDGGFTITGYRITAHDGCTVQGALDFASTTTSQTYTGLTDGSPFNFTVQAMSASLGAETESSASNVVTLTGPTPPTSLSACSVHQYLAAGPNPQVFADIDSTNLALTTTTAAATQTALITGNVDLWTENAGLNQDLGIFVMGGTGAFSSGKVVVWKESGGFAGTFSPNAAAVQAVIPLEASTSYTFKLQWKGNRTSTGTIVAGAGPLAGGTTAVSPTRLTVRILPSSTNPFIAVTSTQQYGLSGSNGSTWQDMDGTNLSETVSPSVDSTAVITANADLFTANAGFNQDIAINVDGTVVAWKESGGFAGTFSPNAAFVSVVVPLTAAGSPHTVKLQWKTNKPEGTAHIYAGAGPWPSGTSLHSPTSLSVELFSTPTDVSTALSNHQYPNANSDGAGWTVMDAANLEIPNLTPGVITNYTYDLSANVDLFTQSSGLNQDVGIFVSGGAYGAGTLVAWKESGGFAGTFSPNAAFVHAILHLQPGGTYTFWIAWKTNKPSGGGTIWAAAGGAYPNSPTRLTAFEISSP